jgi:hypothetical protein
LPHAAPEPVVLDLLDRVAYGVSVSIAQAADCGSRYTDARNFADRLVEIMTRGLARLGLQPIPVERFSNST